MIPWTQLALDYNIKNEIGYGSFGMVYEANRKSD